MCHDFENKRKKLKDMLVPELIAHCQKFPDDEMAWSELYKRYYGLVAAAAYSFVSQPDDAKDVIQEVMIRFFDAIRRGLPFATTAETEGYLWKVIRSIKSNYVKGRERATRFMHLDLPDLEKLANAIQPTDLKEGADVLIVLQEYVARTYAKIKLDVRKLLKAKLVEDLSLASIQAEFFASSSMDSVKQKIHREIGRFRRVLAEEIEKDLSSSKLPLSQKMELENILRRLREKNQKSKSKKEERGETINA